MRSNRNGGQRMNDSKKRDYRRRKKSQIKDVDMQGRGFANGNDVFSVSRENDPIWWCKDPQLVKDAANLPYSWATGPDYFSATGTDVPAVMRLDTVPTPGISRDATSPVNIAARRHYAYIRSTNSGAKNYGPQDLIQYFMAMDSVYACIAYLTRIYGTMNLYSAENRFVPKFLVESMGLSYDDFAEHIPDLRAYINLLIYKASSFAVPSDMGLFERHIQLFSNYYSDYNNTRAQMYYYHPTCLFAWDEANGVLTPQAAPGNSATFATVRTWAESIISPVSASETASIMSGDILKACGDKIIKLNLMKEDLITIPVYSTEVLTQIHNTVVLNAPITADLAITQNAAKDTLIFDPSFQLQSTVADAGKNVLKMKKLIDVPFDEISPALNMVATRDVCFAIDDPNDATRYKLSSCGTEIINSAHMIGLNPGNNTVYNSVFHTGETLPYNIQGALQLLTKLGYWTKFDWAPAMSPIYIDGSNVQHIAPSLRDVTKYTVVDSETVDRLHEVALLSAFTSPAIAQAITVK